MKISYLKHVLVIVTDRCGIADFVDMIGYGLEYDKFKLKGAIFNVLILSDERLRRKFWEEGRRVVREEFGWDKIIRTIEVIYRLVSQQVSF